MIVHHLDVDLVQFVDGTSAEPFNRRVDLLHDHQGHPHSIRYEMDERPRKRVLVPWHRVDALVNRGNGSL